MEYEQQEQHTYQQQPLLEEEASSLRDMQQGTETRQTDALSVLSPWPEQLPPTELAWWGTNQPDTTITLFDATTHNQRNTPEATPPEALSQDVYPHALQPPDTKPAGAQAETAQKAASLEEEVPLLSSKDQYISELWRINRLSPETEESIVAKARTGDQEAKNTLIESCLVYVLYMARVYHVYVEHDDLLDIVGVGNLAITEKVDQALEKATGSVSAYLCGVAKLSIKKYCLYHSRLINIKYHGTPSAEFPQVTSLDALRKNDEGEETLPFDIPTPEPTIPQETDEERCEHVRQALAQLTDKQREVVEMRHGFHDMGTLETRDIAFHLSGKQDTIQKRYHRAIKRLRELLPTWD